MSLLRTIRDGVPRHYRSPMGSRLWHVIAVLLVLGPGAGGTSLSGLWAFDEEFSADTAVDLGPNRLDGEVGGDVRTGQVDRETTSFSFPAVGTEESPEHLVTIDDDPALDPDEQTYAVTVRYRTTTSPSNVVQKGRAGTEGGWWKLEQKRGSVECLFVDAAGNEVSAKVDEVRVNDGQWHTVRCVRTTESVTLNIDFGPGQRTKGTTGWIANSSPVTVGGKLRCDPPDVDCDYFMGHVDGLRIEKGDETG